MSPIRLTTIAEWITNGLIESYIQDYTVLIADAE
jgi:hypothetical protein